MEEQKTDARGDEGGKMRKKNSSKGSRVTEGGVEDPFAPLLKIETESEFLQSFREKENKNDGFGRYFSFPQCTSAKYASQKFAQGFVRTFPVIEWLPKYEFKRYILKDCLIGVTLGFVIAPKAMAHALLAELAPIYGIYSAFFASLVYGIMGKSKWLSIGTCALPALLYGDALDGLGLSAEEMTLVAPMLTFYIGVATFILFIFRLDKLVCLISQAALSAFTTTAAFLIATSQVKYILGLHVTASGFVQTYIAVFKHISEVNIATLILSLFCFLFLISMKMVIAKWGRKRGIPDPGAMLIVMISIALVAIFNLDERYGIDVVGPTRPGMPPFVIPWKYVSDANTHLKLLVEGLVIALINFILAIAIAKNFARRSKSELVVSQELKALASVNTVGAFFGTQVAGGSFSGSAIIASLQAPSMMHNFVNALVMMLILLVLTPIIELLPKCTLAAIIIVALPSLVNFEKPKTLFKVKLDDFFMWVATFIVTLFGGVQYGVIGGIAVSLIVLIFRAVRSELVELGQIPNTNIYRSIDRFPDAKTFDGIKMFRLDASLSFANIERYEEKLCKAILLIKGRTESTPEHVASPCNTSFAQSIDVEMDTVSTTVILNCEAVNDIDTVGIEMLCRFADVCKKNNIRLLFSGWKYSVRQTLYASRSELLSKDPNATRPAPLDGDLWYLNLHDAVLRARGETPPSSPPNAPHLTRDGDTKLNRPRLPSKTITTQEVTPGGVARNWDYVVNEESNANEK